MRTRNNSANAREGGAHGSGGRKGSSVTQTSATGEPDYRCYYDLESFLFQTVHRAFHENGHMSASDFFCIIIWKANRAKSKVARNLLSRGHTNLESAVHHLTVGVARQPTARDRLQYLLGNWGFRLPIASAILSVCYPDEFTVYDVRVAEGLGFKGLGNTKDFDRLWKDYNGFVKAVRTGVPDEMTLRDKDRYLWGKSFYEQLVQDIKANFGHKIGVGHDPTI